MSKGIKVIGKSVYVTDEDIEGSIKYIKENKIDTIFINSLYYSKDNLDFLKECVTIKKIAIDVGFITNLNGLYKLPSLKELSITENENKLEIDLSNFPELEILRLEWNSNVTGLFSLANLRYLQLIKYKPKSKDLVELVNLKKLESLTLTHGNINSLKGIEELGNLKEIQLNYLRNLTNISNVEGLKYLKNLEIENCKKISDIYTLKEILNLDRLALINCGELDSLEFIESMKNLKSLVFDGTNIKDGDLSYCKNIDYVFFTDKKHYSLRLKDINKNL
ncbi:leucine-rich repeat domain-containing protein [Niallia taxi]|nr:leucine-rich repeat domain-containing protein [Niallia taxi]MDE5055328.1 leucine-rich repeat domain-containing protein [Niallia taxi]